MLAKLERELGCTLFNSSAKGVLLTLVGEHYLKEISPILLGLAQATAHISNEKARSNLRILHCAPSFSPLWLSPRIHKFRDSHPEFQLTLSYSYENSSFSRDNIDIAVRHGFPSRTGNRSTLKPPAMKECRCWLLSPAYSERHLINQVGDLIHHALILSKSPLIQWPQWFAAQQLPQLDKGWLFRFDRSYYEP